MANFRLKEEIKSGNKIWFIERERGSEWRKISIAFAGFSDEYNFTWFDDLSDAESCLQMLKRDIQ